MGMALGVYRVIVEIRFAVVNLRTRPSARLQGTVGKISNRYRVVLDQISDLVRRR